VVGIRSRYHSLEGQNARWKLRRPEAGGTQGTPKMMTDIGNEGMDEERNPWYSGDTETIEYDFSLLVGP
jgi:hypothetical protein